ncbi:IS3 family transposase [Lampropedia aestuarii]|uniref:IS3 family transposase n=1 Tax=Lampropedia aestuarii TaxID=2562762 RepID=UPI001F0FC8E5
MAECVIRTLKDPCVHRYSFERLQHASRVVADWVGLHNKQRPYLAPNMPPAEVGA